MIKNILLQASRSYNPYVQSNEIWGAGQTFAGELDNDFNGRKFVSFDNSTNWNIISTNGNNAIAIKTDGTLWQWGPNAVGQLGLNDTVTRSSPVQLGTLTWVSASAQNQTSYAIKSDGTLWAWGNNAAGELGVGDLISRSSPVQLGTNTWKNIFGTGLGHVIALRGDDTIWGWSDTRNSFGAYGNGERPGAFGQIDGGSLDWNDVSPSNSYTIAVGSDGKMWAWGFNTNGQLGLRDTVNRSSPVQIGTLATWVSASAGRNNSVMAIQNNGTLWAWGVNTNGQLGLLDTITRSSPVQVGTDTNWKSVESGTFHTIAIKTDGTIWGWGGGTGVSGYAGQFAANAYELKRIDNLTSWVSASYNGFQVITLKTDGTMWTWGNNTNGQLGLGNTITRSSPVQVGTLNTWASISLSGTNTTDNFCFGLRTDGTLWSWGSNNSVALGLNLGTAAHRSSPTQIGTRTWNSIAAGQLSALAVRSDGTLWSWGFFNSGILGLNNAVNHSSPVQIGTDTNWSKITLGTANTAFAIRTDGTLWAWGDNTTYGALGLGDVITRSSPVQVGTRTDWADVKCGERSTSAVRNDGTLWTWGRNDVGQLGLSDTNHRSSPVQVGTETNWLISKFPEALRGGGSVYAIKTDKSLWSWGIGSLKDNIFTGGSTNTNYSSPVQIGIGESWEHISHPGGLYTAFAITTDNKLYAGPALEPNISFLSGSQRSSPVQIGTETNWASIHAPTTIISAIKTDGTLWGWGLSLNGFPIINSNFSSVDVPKQIDSDIWKKFRTGNQYVIGIKNDDTLWSWGNNTTNGRLGLGDVISRSSPVQIGTLLWNEVGTSQSGNNTFAIRNDGTLWGWGQNNAYQLGLNDIVSRSSPVQIGGGTDWYAVYGSETHTAAIKNRLTKELHTAGVANTYSATHRLINGWDGVRRSPILLSQSGVWNNITVGTNHTLGIKPNGTLWSWGTNNSGELGLGDVISRSSPVQIGTLNNWSKAFGFNSYTMAIKTDGTLWAWGVNASFANLGLNNKLNAYSSPVQVGTRLWNDISHNGDWSTFGIRDDGTLWSWGNNVNGKLGLNDTLERSSPVQIGTETNWLNFGKSEQNNTAQFAIKTNNSMYVLNGALTPNTVAGISFYKSSPVQVTSTRNWKSVNAGTSFTIAISTSGSMWAWGTQANGVIGNNTVTASASQESPVQIGTLTTWASASAGEGNVVAIRNDNTIWTWGANNLGQLAQNDTISRSSPVQVGTLTNWLRVSAGRSHVMAIKTDGTLWGWGINTNNNIGDGTITSRSSAVQIGTRTDWSKISAGDGHTMAITTGGELYGMGMGTVGQQGTNNVSSGTQPQRVGTSTWTDVAAGHQMTAAVRSDGTLWAWGQGTDGRLGLLRNRSLPNYVDASTTFTSISTGDETALAIAYDGTLWSWGGNGNGALGFNDTTSRSSPVQVGTRTWNKISVGDFSFVLAVRSDNTLWSWGGNAFGNLGFNDTTNRSSPVQVGTLSNWKEVSSGYLHSHAVKTDGTLWGWGYNALGGLGLGDAVNRSSPVQVGTLTNWSKVGSIFATAFGLKTDGTLWSWGRGGEGQRGSNNALSTSSPVQIGTRTWSFIADGGGGLPSMQTYHMLAVRSDGTLWTWGKNDAGQLGLNDLVSRSSPVQIGTETNWASGEVGGSSTMAIKTNGTLWAWGLNTSAMLGLGNTINRSSPVQVGTLSSWVSASIGEQHTVLLQNNGYVLTTGASNQSGEPGFETNRAINRSNPVQIGIDTNWQKVNIGNTSILGSAPPQILAQKTDGTLWTWGGNTVGNLGDGTLTTKSSPVQLGNETTWVNFDAEQHFVGIKQY